MPMHLSAYMAERNLSDEQVAGAISKNRVTISRYRRGIERPSSTTIGEIFAWSDGKVTPNDWFDPIEDDSEQHEAANDLSV